MVVFEICAYLIHNVCVNFSFYELVGLAYCHSLLKSRILHISVHVWPHFIETNRYRGIH